MNPISLLDAVLSFLARYAPILIAHVLLLTWIALRVLDPATIPTGDTLWDVSARTIDESLAAVGLSLERWYVFATVAIAYLAAFRWLHELVSGLPGLRAWYTVRYGRDVLRHASTVLRVRPRVGEVESELSNLIDRRLDQLRASGQPHPRAWLLERDRRLRSYYGTVLVFLGLAVAWAIEGGTLARSESRVWELVILLALAALACRWMLHRHGSNEADQVAWWALHEQEREGILTDAEGVRWKRTDVLGKELAHEQALARTPGHLLWRMSRGLPMPVRWRKSSMRLLPRVPPSPSEDWDLIASEAMRFADEEHKPPGALHADGFTFRFAALLECSGAGLCILTPSALGLAPAAEGGGSGYDFSTRRHRFYGSVILELSASPDLSIADFRAMSHPERPAFIVEVGDVPIEQLAQLFFPYDPEIHWGRLLDLKIEDAAWEQLGAGNEVSVSGAMLATRVQARPGASYLLGTRTAAGTLASVAFQCFRIADAPKLLIAWRILRVTPGEDEDFDFGAWWRPSSWKPLLRGGQSVP